MIGIIDASLEQAQQGKTISEYQTLLIQYFSKAIPELTPKIYPVTEGIPNDIHECQAWVISGSPKSAYENDEWIIQLGKFIQSCHSNQKKLIGICFGHQMIAHFLGGRVEKSSEGWGVGVLSYQILSNEPWMSPLLKECSLLFSHQDQVLRLPKEAKLIAGSSFCPHQMFTIGTHILTFQGHPEFSRKLALSKYNQRQKIIGEKTYQNAIASMNDPVHDIETGQWMRAFLKI